MTVVNLQHALTQNLGHTPVPVTRDTLEMEKHVKVRNYLYPRWKHSGCVQSISFF